MLPSLLAIALHSAHAFPTGAYPDCAPDNRGACPPELGETWELISWIPAGSVDSVRPEELALGSGISADVAWRYTTGRFDVTVAVLDSGIVWSDSRLRTKVLLNAGELPDPLDAAGNPVPGGDVDGNGVFNIDDWVFDWRVGPADGGDDATGILDPSDLIAAFSDGVDDDGNGYVDDIAGWDFFGHDNDPWADLTDSVNVDHGTGVMKDAVEGADDGGGVGVCPNCALLPLRTGDAFISDGDRVAAAIAYASERQARVAAMAMGALSHGAHTAAAIRAADAAGMVLVAAAGDENSYHHNWPATEDPILYVHSIRADNQDESSGAYSYLNVWNCNNWGPRLDLVAPGNGCATAATAVIAGAAGLIASAGRDVGLELSSDEIKGLLRTTVDDVWLTAEESDTARTYASEEGWDPFYGYGRINAGRAVAAVFAGEIPPVARLDGPGWFTWIDPDVPVAILGAATAPRGTLGSWVLEAGAGFDPRTWTAIASGTSEVDGTITTADLSAWGDVVLEDIVDEDLLARVDRAHAPLITLRLTVTDAAGRATEDRMGLWAQRDPTRKPGFPVDMGGSVEASPALADLDGDGVFEVIIGVSSGAVHVLDGTGAERPGFPVLTETGVVAGPAVGDVDGDGAPEIVGATLGGSLYAWEADGTVLPGFPVHAIPRTNDERGPATAWDNGFMSTPALGDIDGDGALEIVIGGLDQRLYVWRGDGTAFPGYPLELCAVPEGCAELGARIVSSPALGDIDGDGDLDCAIGTNEVPNNAAGPVYLLDLATTALFPGTPLNYAGMINESLLPVIGEGHPGSVALADVDGDGDLEMLSNPMLGTNGVIHHDGTELLDMKYTGDASGPRTNFTGGSFLALVTSPAFGDLTGDGVPDPVVGGAGVDWLVSLALTRFIDYQHAAGAWDGRTGASLPGWPRQVDDVSFLVAPAIADVDLDGDTDALYVTGGHVLYAWDAEGNSARGFPKFTGGWSIAGPAVGDIDGDGWLDVVVTTREGDVFAWTTAGAADQRVQWASTRHDAQNTGNWNHPLPTQAGPERYTYGEVGGCCGGGGDGAWLVLAPLALALRRRRTTDR